MGRTKGWVKWGERVLRRRAVREEERKEGEKSLPIFPPLLPYPSPPLALTVKELPLPVVMPTAI